MTSFDALNLSAPILRALETMSFDKPTEIQAATIPAIKDGSDVIGVAQTGSGKTAAFVIPALEHMSAYEEKAKPGMPRALILAPTRELAIQITDKIKELGAQMRATCCTVYGGAPYKTQIHILRRGVDILVATPGRLKDHMKQGNIYLDEVEYFVLDEADRMLDLGFVDEVRQISKKLPASHQSVMFSATMTPKIRDLAETLLKNPVNIEMARQSTITDNLDHSVMMVPGHKKRDLLDHLIETIQPEKSLVFVRTRRDADELCDYLKALGLTADAIHGDKQQRARQRTINGFKSGRFDFLVATDVAARGIDVQDITHVFNMDVPIESESYVHRIGRTARGTAHGKAITLCGKGDIRLLKAIESLIKMTIRVDEDQPFHFAMDKNFSGKKFSDKRGSGKRGTGTGRRGEARKFAGKRIDGKRDTRNGDDNYRKDRRSAGAARRGERNEGSSYRPERSDAGQRPARARTDRAAEGGGQRSERTRSSQRPERPSSDRYRDDQRPARTRSDRSESGGRSERSRNSQRSERSSSDRYKDDQGASRSRGNDNRSEKRTDRRPEKARSSQRSERAESNVVEMRGKKSANTQKPVGKKSGKKRPAVAARKANKGKAANFTGTQGKAPKTTSGRPVKTQGTQNKRSAASGGNQPLRRR